MSQDPRFAGDPLLVRAGRGLVPTPYAAAIHDHVHELTRGARAMLQPRNDRLELAALERNFTLRANEAFVAFFSVPLMQAVDAVAPHVRLCFTPKPNKDVAALRDGSIDLEIGVGDTTAPEMRARLLFHDRYVGVVRAGHPLLAEPNVTPERYAACKHVAASPRGEVAASVDEPLAALGLRREIHTVVPGFPDAMRIARHSDLVALVPQSCLGNALASDHAAKLGLQHFDLPVPTPEFTIDAMWHPRMDADPAHGWLRGIVFSVVQEAYPRLADNG
ncbi:LysR substrate-binding domain-containing protein [Salinisphaera sp. SWV1]|uniref:LysR substrate-binding domain-containing protein n=1 Tax=Salinisphaera sp. SWV1 TaxID=3454139 RepID=UPI003F83CAC1